MKEETTTVREFLRNYKKFANKKKAIIIMKNGKPIGTYLPYKEWEKQNEDQKGVIITKELIDQFSFKSGEKDLSQKIDEIAYGAPNPYRNDNT